METCITVNNAGYGGVVSKMELYAGKKLLDFAYIDKYNVSVQNNFVMFFTYDNGSNIPTHAFSVDKVIIDFVAYVPLKVSQKEERRKKREENKRKAEEKKREDSVKKFRREFCFQTIELQSTNLYTVCYNPDKELLRVVFRSNLHTVYLYHGVEIEVFTGLLCAPSHGRFFNSNIRGNYMWEYE